MLTQQFLNHTLSLRPTVVATVIDDGAVLLDLESKYFFRLNSTAWAIAQLFEAGATTAEVKTRCRSWGASTQDDEAMDALIETLMENDLLIVSPGTRSANVEYGGLWTPPVIERQAEPLQRLISSAFDPSVPLAE